MTGVLNSSNADNDETNRTKANGIQWTLEHEQSNSERKKNNGTQKDGWRWQRVCVFSRTHLPVLSNGRRIVRDAMIHFKLKRWTLQIIRHILRSGWDAFGWSVAHRTKVKKVQPKPINQCPKSTPQMQINHNNNKFSGPRTRSSINSKSDIWPNTKLYRANWVRLLFRNHFNWIDDKNTQKTFNFMKID